MKKIMLVFGTRPEAIKMCPLALELKKRNELKTVICVTGQHREILDDVMRTFGVLPDFDIDIMKNRQTLFDITEKVLNGIKLVLEKEKPDLVLVHGDTASAFSAALACFYLRIPVGHVEAGLRTGNIDYPFPEEYYRKSIDIISVLDFAPTETARENLMREGKSGENIYVTGNTVVDALKMTADRNYRSRYLDFAKDRRLVLLTIHRRESLEGETVKDILGSVRDAIEGKDDVRVIFPVHPNITTRQAADEVFEKCGNVLLTPPMNISDFHSLLCSAYLVLTDSGGVQEEAVSLGIPTLVLRKTTERTEGLAKGILSVAGTDPEKIRACIDNLLCDDQEYRKMRACGKSDSYGDGNASVRIADIICGI